MSSDGVFQVSRRIWDHPVLAPRGEFSRIEAWLWLISNANWQPGEYNYRGTMLTVGRGQLVASIRFLAGKWSWSEKKVRNFLNLLLTQGMIGIEKGTLISVVTICNYESYQFEPGKKGTQRARSGHARGTIYNKGIREEEDYPPSEGQDPEPDLKAIAFGPVLRYLADGTGRTERSVRGQIGKWIKQHGEAATISAVSAAQRAGAVEPINYTNAALRNGRAVTAGNDWLGDWVAEGIEPDNDSEGETLRGENGRLI